MQTIKCVVVGDGAVGKVSISFPPSLACSTGRTKIEPHPDSRQESRLHQREHDIETKLVVRINVIQWGKEISNL